MSSAASRIAQITPQRTCAVAHAMPDASGQDGLHLQLFDEKRFRSAVGQHCYLVTQRAQFPCKGSEILKPMSLPVTQRVFNNQTGHNFSRPVPAAVVA